MTDTSMNNFNIGFLPPNCNSHFLRSVEDTVHNLQRRLIPCFREFSEISRFFVYPEIYPKFVDTWFNAVFGWWEIKDGPKLKFFYLHR